MSVRRRPTLCALPNKIVYLSGVLLELRKGAYLTPLHQLFRDSLSQRFAHFLARITLPDPEEEKQEAVTAQPRFLRV